LIRRKIRSGPPAPGFIASSVALLAALVCGASATRAAKAPAPRPSADKTRVELEQRFTGTVKPFLQTYCIACHGKNMPQAQLDLSSYTSLATAAADYAHLGLMVEKLASKEMPPKEYGKQPTAAQRDAVLTWLKGMRKYEAERNAGDPGIVLARRLSNAEYDYSIRDLTGADIRPTKEFPVDPANEAGFDNSGESLTVSPALMKKYLQAARGIADHLVLKSSGFGFATHPVLVETDRDKYGILRIVDFYKQQPTDYADYFQAAWRFRHRAALGTPQATLQQVASQAKVSPRYLELVWTTLNDATVKVGPIAKLQELWNALPAPDPAKPEIAREGCVAMRDWVGALRPKVASKFDNLQLPGFSPGGQWNLLWKDRQYAANRRTLNPAPLQIDGQPKPVGVDPRPGRGPKKDAKEPQLMEKDPNLFVPADEAARAPYLASFQKFCSVFPDAFYIPDRGRMEFYDPNDRGRLLSAGFHNMMGYFRDDTPLAELILDEKGRQELDRLWVDFDMNAQVSERMHLEFIFYERAEAHTITEHDFDFARSEDKDATSDAKIKRLADAYLGKARKNLNGNVDNSPAYKAMEEHFRLTSVNIRAIQKIRAAAEPSHLTALIDFARRAYRRPLTPAERIDILAFYRSMRDKGGLSHDEAMRDSIVSVLMSPNFLYRVDQEAGAGALPAGVRTIATGKAPAAAAMADDTVVKPLPDYALASRLSYFLWSSLPDDELLAHAAAGDLHKPEVLTAQTRRMLKDPRVRAMALEFGGNWLDFRRFEEHNAVDRDRFPAFNDDLRQAMFEEPVRFLTNTFQNDSSLLDLLYGKYTFVNAPLAKHYKMTDVKVPENGWVRVEDADRYGRGGLLPMSVFLTQNSPGLRTSPVKRGYWLVRKVLGEHIPPPPATVAELPKDEGQLGDKTLRQALEQHRKDPACAGCHARFDAFGLVFEGYGPIGDQRTKDLGGKAVDTRAPFPGGIEKTGLTGLREFLREQRQTEFVDNFARKMLSYSLGRGLQASDDPLLLQMRQKLSANGYRFSTLVETIVTSKQFRNRRTSASVAQN
jgi:cytochrome c553